LLQRERSEVSPKLEEEWLAWTDVPNWTDGGSGI